MYPDFARMGNYANFAKLYGAPLAMSAAAALRYRSHQPYARRQKLNKQIRAYGNIKGRTRYPKKGKRKPKGKVGRNKQQIATLRNRVNASMGTLTYRDVAANVINASPNECHYGDFINASSSTIELALAQLRYYDPTAPTSLVVAPAATGTYRKVIRIVKSTLSLELRNNYDLGCNLRAYACSVKHDTSILPSVAMTNALADMSNSLAITSTAVFPTDCPQLLDLWNVKQICNVTLRPGESKTVSYASSGSYEYDPSLTDSHALDYQRTFDGSVIMIRMCGLPAHDTSVTTEHGLAKASMDYILRRTFVVDYDAGINIKFLYVADNLDTFTNNGYVGHTQAPSINIRALT